jgi:hypothetical protein
MLPREKEWRNVYNKSDSSKDCCWSTWLELQRGQCHEFDFDERRIEVPYPNDRIREHLLNQQERLSQDKFPQEAEEMGFLTAPMLHADSLKVIECLPLNLISKPRPHVGD